MTLSSGVGALVVISVSAAVVSLMSPDGELKKYINLVSVLAVLASLAVPVAAALGNVPEIVAGFEEADFDGAAGGFDAVAAAKAQIEKSTAEQVEAEFSLEHGSVSVDILLDARDLSSIDIKKITVTVPRGTDGERIERFVCGLYLNTAVVEVRDKNDG